ncbi:MAG: hypothetical protein LBJ64_03800 [Deltaproteobacteria bacterium]|jgi:hypothetical protein|nr:hypothetical protein [Deltaproteobacteria bacterium]
MTAGGFAPLPAADAANRGAASASSSAASILILILILIGDEISRLGRR